MTNEKYIEKLFEKPFICAIIGDTNSGKSNLIYHLIEKLKKEYVFNLYYFGLKCKIENAKEINSIDELENIKDSLIFIDEFFSLFDLDDRKKKLQIETTLRLLFHNNNVLVLCGLPENFKKFISAKVNLMFYKQVTFDDFINGSSIKKNILKYSGREVGSSILNLKKEECIIYDGKHYRRYLIPYMKSYDTKINNVRIFVPKNVQKMCKKENVQKI